MLKNGNNSFRSGNWGTVWFIGGCFWCVWRACPEKSLSIDQLKSFETGVKYQMYHAILLLILSFNLNMDTSLERNMIHCFIVGTFLFSFSIYALVIGKSKGKNMKILGPITPIGGLFLVMGWALLLYSFIGNFV